MLKELIPLTVSAIGNEEQKTVNARDLHAFLEVGKDFSTWIKDKIEKYDFKEGKDYVKFSPNSGKTSNGGRPRVEYFLTVSMAKEISMLENNEKGNQARKYFLACEEELNALKLAAPALPDYSNLPKIQILRMAIESEEQRIAAEKKNEELTKRLQLAAPKVSAYNDLIDDQGTYNATAVAKILHMKRCDLFTWFKSNQVAYLQKDGWLPYSTWEKKQWALVKITEGNNKKTGEPFTSQRLRFTVAGIFQIHKMMQAQKINVPEQLNLNLEGAQA